MYIEFTKEQALEAIIARIRGDFDNPQLLKIGALSTDKMTDIDYIIYHIHDWKYPGNAKNNTKKPPYPDFCYHPDKCAASGRCERDICCAD